MKVLEVREKSIKVINARIKNAEPFLTARYTDNYGTCFLDENLDKRYITTGDTKVGNTIKVGDEICVVMKIINETNFVAVNEHGQELDLNVHHEIDYVVEEIEAIKNKADKKSIKSKDLDRFEFHVEYKHGDGVRRKFTTIWAKDRDAAIDKLHKNFKVIYESEEV